MLGQVVLPVGFIAGLVTGAAAAVLAALLWRRARPALVRLRYLLAAGLVAGFALAAAVIYLAIGARSAAIPAGIPADTAPGSTAMAAAAGASSGARSMELEVNALAARLAREGGSEGDWTLLAQAYDFLGRPEDAKRARGHIAAAGAMPVSQMGAASLAAAAAVAAPAASAAPASAASAAHPAETSADANGWLAVAEQRRTQHDYAGARAAYARVAELHAMSSQSWADYADVLGSLAGGSLTGDAATAIDNALRLDPNNPKALWLRASQAHEQHHFSEALTWWRRLRSVLPPGSPDTRIIDANIAEAEALANGTPPAAPAAGSPASAAEGAQLSGTVSLDARFSSRVPPDATLFIYAKAADSPGPPLAVLRLTPRAWPVSFRLDDSQAMLPARRLSQFDKVIVEARISRTGQATPASGDLYVRSPVVHPAPGEKLALVISEEIG
jgi:cytochrome c-type biogenesis protein CcmH